MKNSFLIILLLLATPVLLSSNEPVKVKVEKVKIKENFNTIEYGARLEPFFIYKYYAPITGTIDNIYYKEGDFVEPGSVLMTVRRKNQIDNYKPLVITANTGGIITGLTMSKSSEVIERSEIFSIADVSMYKTSLLMSDQDINLIKTGDKVFIKSHEGVTGTIIKKSVLPDMKTGLFNIEVSIPKLNIFFPGYFVFLEIRVNHIKGITIPVKLVSKKFGKNFVTVFKDGKLQNREIIIDKVVGTDILISSGLTQGEFIVSAFNKAFNDGDEAIIQEKEKKGEGKNKPR